MIPHHFTVSLHDTDAAGVLFFAHLFRHAHDAYEAFMAGRGVPLHGLIAAGRCHLPLVHAAADYRHPMRHGDEVAVELEVAEVGERRFHLHYRFLAPDGALLATAATTHAAIGSDGRAIALPEALRAALLR